MNYEFLPENIYGHIKRLHWIISHLNEQDIIAEFGCGTGYMLSYPITAMGYDITGWDLDKESIALGKKIFQEYGLDPNRLKALDIAELSSPVDVIIASELLEHIPDGDITDILTLIRSKLKPGGKLLVTVPNGYGWFELESFLWFKTGLGFLIEKLMIEWAIRKVKTVFFGHIDEYRYPSTVADSPHVQYFTYQAIQKLLCANGFEVVSATGSVLFAGPFSNLFFTGINPIIKLNCMLGNWFPGVAAGFYLGCKLSD